LGFQVGFQNCDTDGNGNYNGMTGGDILIASVESNGSFTLESNGTIDGQGGASNGQGPDGGEFFYEEFFKDRTEYQKDVHQEVVSGALAYLSGDNFIISTTFDPNPFDDDSDLFNTSGIREFNLTDGTYLNHKILCQKDTEGNQGKATGIGDIELLTDLPPVEIGNRVWLDSDLDGIQDANESGIAGIELILLEGSDCSGLS